MSFKHCVGCVEPFLTPFIEEDNLKMSALMQHRILGEDTYCLRLKCKGNVEVLEVEKMVVVGNYPVWSMSRRQMVHCKKCFYHASVLAHKWNSRANPKKQQQRQRLAVTNASLNRRRFGGCLPPVIPELNVWSMSMEETLEKKDSWNDKYSVDDASVNDYFLNKKEQQEAQQKLQQEQFELKEAIRQQAVKEELQRQLQEQVKRENWISQQRGIKQLLLPQQKQESRDPQASTDNRDDQEDDRCDRQDDVLLEESPQQKPRMTEASEKSFFSLGGRSRESKKVVLVAVSSQTPEKEIFDSSGNFVARGGKMILRRQPRIPSYTC